MRKGLITHMSVYTPATDPFFIGDPCINYADYVPSVHKDTFGECCPTSILSCLKEIKECLEETVEDYEKKVIPLCETLADDTEIPFFRIIETIYDKKANTSESTVKDVLSDLTTPYVVIDEANVAGQKVKVVEKCDAPINSGIQGDWANF